MINLLADVPSSIAGLPTWGANLLTVGGLVTFIILGLATSRLYTRSQVEDMKAQHASAIETTKAVYQGRVDDAVRREGEWRETATKWQDVASTLADSIDPLTEGSQTILNIVQEMQRHQQRRTGR